MNNKKTIPIYKIIIVVFVCLAIWGSYKIGYYNAQIDFFKNIATITNKNSNVVDTKQKISKSLPEISSIKPQLIKPFIGEKNSMQNMVELIDSSPIYFLSNALKQTIDIPQNKLDSVDKPRYLIKQLLATAGYLDFDANDIKLVESVFNAEVSVSFHINKNNNPTSPGSLMSSGNKKLYISFLTPALPDNDPYYLIKISNSDYGILHYKSYKFSDDNAQSNKRSHIWVKRQWLVGEYEVEFFVLDSELAHLQTVSFSIVE